MSENTINASLRRLGYDKDTMTGHGFRHMASTLLNEMGFRGDAIERQLGHKEPGVRGVYNKAEHLPERRSEEHTSELQSLMRISYAVFCLKKKNQTTRHKKHDDI